MRLNAHQAQTVADDGTVVLLQQRRSGGSGTATACLNDAYAFRDGAVAVGVAGGVQGASTRFLDATPDGSSVFVATNAQLAETDADRSVDIYIDAL